MAVNPSGEILTYTSPHPPVSAINNEKKDVNDLLSSADGDYYEGYNGSYITLNFGDKLDVGKGAKLVLRTDMFAVKTSIHVQVQDKKGKWKDVTSFVPRAYWSTDIIDMSDYLPDARGNLKVRLYFTANHKVDFVGLDTSPQSRSTVQQAQLVSAVHSKNSDPTVYGESMENDVKSKLLYGDGAYAELMPYEQIKLAFSLQEASNNLSRDYILVCKGHYSTLPVGTLINPTVYGSWIAPIAYDWHNVEVVVDLPSTTTLVKVIIQGRSDFKAFIDNAMLVMIDIQKVETDRGTLSVSLDVISWRPLNQTHDEIRAVASLTAYPNDSYRICSIKLQTGLVPSNQNAKVYIEYASQSNDINYVVDPAAVEREQYDTFNSIAFGVGQAVGFGLQVLVLFYGPPPIQLYSGQVKMFASQITSSAVMYVLTNTASDPDNKYAGVGTGYSAVWEEWPYPIGPYRDDQNFAFVTVASGNYELIWQFDKGSSDIFQITTTAWVHWGEVYSYYGGAEHIHEFYELRGAGWTSQSLIFTTYA